MDYFFLKKCQVVSTNYKNETPKAASIQMLTQDEGPTRDSYELEGWGTEGTTKEYDVGQTYEFTEDKTVKAVWKQKAIPVDPGKMDPADRNKTVTYYNDSGVNEWIPFYNDGTYNYIIAKDYIDPESSSQLDPNTGIKAYKYDISSESWKRDCYWGGSAPVGTHQTRNNYYPADIKKEGFWKRYEAIDTSDMTSSVMAYSILNKSWWKQYISNQAEDAIGSPTLEMLATAYDSRYSKGIYWHNGTGYGLEIENAGWGNSFLRTDDPAFINCDESQCYAIWLASPCYLSTSALWTLFFDAGEFSSRSYNAPSCGLRPVVRLKYGVQIVKDLDGNLSLSGRIV